MTPGARIAAAIEVLDDIDKHYRPVAEALKDWGLSHRFAGAKDRAAIGNIVYDAERRRRSLAWMTDADTSRALALGAVAFSWGVGANDLAAQLDVPHAPAPLTPEETARLGAANLAGAPDAVRANVPGWLASSLARSLGKEWIAELEAMAERPPLDIRVNRLKADRAKVQRALSRYDAAETPFSPDGLRLPPTKGEARHPNLQPEPGFQKGWFEIQDEGSQLAALMVGAAAGEQVLDLCAGGGGKTLALAAAMANKGQIHATDRDKHRLAPIFDRLRRAGTRNVQVHPAGSLSTPAMPPGSPPPERGRSARGTPREGVGGGHHDHSPADLPSADPPLAGEGVPSPASVSLLGKMDRVLIDAPCSGSGTWRRHPDAKWRLTERVLADRIATQSALLRQAAGFVRPGGLLVYVTCSLLPEENEDQMAAFLDQTPGFTALPANDVIAPAGLEAGAASRLAAAVLTKPHGLLMTPQRTGTDGFFVAAMRKAV